MPSGHNLDVVDSVRANRDHERVHAARGDHAVLQVTVQARHWVVDGPLRHDLVQQLVNTGAWAMLNGDEDARVAQARQRPGHEFVGVSGHEANRNRHAPQRNRTKLAPYGSIWMFKERKRGWRDHRRLFP